MILGSPITPLEHAARHVLDWLHGTIGLPWAWSIVALTVIVRILLVPLAVKQIHSMQNLQKFAPQMKEIQQKYKQDKQKQNEELMKFYKEHKINPAASCLPLIAQIPVFISLYFALNTFSKEAQAAKSIIHGDLHWLGLIKITEPATKGWGPLLIVIYVASQLSSSYFMSTTVDRNQRMLLMVLPILFVPFIIRFKTGLVLYWVTTNLWTVGQGLITRRLMPKTPVGKIGPRRSSRTPPKPEPEPAGDGAQGKQVEEKPAAQPQQAQAAPRRVKRKKKRARR